MFQALLQQLLPHLVPIAVSGLSILGGWVMVKLKGLIAAKTGESKLGQGMTRLLMYVGASVSRIEARVRPALPEMLADRKLTKEEGAFLFSMAMDEVKAMLGESGLQELQGLLKLGAPALEELITGIIEREVARQSAPLGDLSVLVPGRAPGELARLEP